MAFDLRMALAARVACQPSMELSESGVEEGEVNCRERLGGLLRYYHRDAA